MSQKFSNICPIINPQKFLYSSQILVHLTWCNIPSCSSYIPIYLTTIVSPYILIWGIPPFQETPIYKWMISGIYPMFHYIPMLKIGIPSFMGTSQIRLVSDNPPIVLALIFPKMLKKWEIYAWWLIPRIVSGLQPWWFQWDFCGGKSST